MTPHYSTTNCSHIRYPLKKLENRYSRDEQLIAMSHLHISLIYDVTGRQTQCRTQVLKANYHTTYSPIDSRSKKELKTKRLQLRA